MRILHVFRSPVGGLFRHVRDLARGQHALGHDVGILCDSSTGGESAEALLYATAQWCRLGIIRTPISKMPGLGDLAGMRAVQAAITRTGAEVVHGHGAKGGVYARLAGWRAGVVSLYTPHGGSLHYQWRSPSGALFLATEAAMARLGSGFCFVCDFEKDLVAQKVGLAGKPWQVAFNGLWPEEHVPVPLADGATDFLFVGELRHLKGVDILLQALAQVPQATLTVVGDGPDEAAYRALAQNLGLANRTRFAGRLGIAKALSLGQIMVMPSRNESFPYVVLETAAATRPLIASPVGGIPEIVPQPSLLPALTPDALAGAMRQAMEHPEMARAAALQLADAVKARCSAEDMSRKTTEFYARLLAGRRPLTVG